PDFRTLVQTLGQHHRLLYGRMAPGRPVLLQLARDEGSNGISFLLAPVDPLDDESGLPDIRDDLIDCLLIGNLPFLAIDAFGLGDELRRLPPRQPRGEIPVFFRLTRLNL